MEAQRPTQAQQANIDQSRVREHGAQPLFTCQIRDDPSLPAEAICHACLEALDRLAEDAFHAADVASQQFASGKLRPIGRRLDGLRLRLQIWMLDVGLDATGEISVPQSQNDYFERAAGRKIRMVSQACQKVASCLKWMCEDFHLMATDLETAGRARMKSVTRSGEDINLELDNVESIIHSLTGFVNPILMARALRTGTGPYSEVNRQVCNIKNGARSSDARCSPQLGSDVGFMDEGQLSSSSEDSVFKIHSTSQDFDRPRSPSHHSASSQQQMLYQQGIPHEYSVPAGMGSSSNEPPQARAQGQTHPSQVYPALSNYATFGILPYHDSHLELENERETERKDRQSPDPTYVYAHVRREASHLLEAGQEQSDGSDDSYFRRASRSIYSTENERETERKEQQSPGPTYVYAHVRRETSPLLEAGQGQSYDADDSSFRHSGRSIHATDIRESGIQRAQEHGGDESNWRNNVKYYCDLSVSYCYHGLRRYQNCFRGRGRRPADEEEGCCFGWC